MGIRRLPTSPKILVSIVLAFLAVGLGLYLVAKWLDSSPISFQRKTDATN